MENLSDGIEEISIKKNSLPKRSFCTFRTTTIITACAEEIAANAFLAGAVTRFLDVRGILNYGINGAHRYSIYKDSFYEKVDKYDLELLEIYYIWGIILTSVGIILPVFLIVVAARRSKTGLYAWLFTAAIVYFASITLVCLLFFEGRWGIFILIIILTIFKMWEFAMILATITEIVIEKSRLEDKNLEYYYDVKAKNDFGLQMVMRSEDSRRILLTNGTQTGLESLPFNIPPNYPVIPYETIGTIDSHKTKGETATSADASSSGNK